MMTAEEYLSRSRLFRRLKGGPHGRFVELYAARLVRDGHGGHGTWRSLSLLCDLINWFASSGSKLTDLDEGMVEQYLRHRSGKRRIQPGDRAALKRLLSVLREAATIAPAALPSLYASGEGIRSAPYISGKGVANPLAILLAAALMLEHVKHADLAQRLRRSIDLVVHKDRIFTVDEERCSRPI